MSVNYHSVQAYRLIAQGYEVLDNLVIACEGRIAEIVSEEIDRRSEGIKKDALEKIISRKSSRYEKCIARAKAAKHALSQLDLSVNGGL